MKHFLTVLLTFLSIATVNAQTSPNLRQGQVLTPAQWNALFAGKQDYTGGPTAPPRVRLLAPTTFYVAPPPTGNDTSDCLKTTTPCATLQRVADLIGASYDLQCQAVTISMAAGTYTANTTFGASWVGGCGTSSVPPVKISGAGPTTIINAGSGVAINVGSVDGPPVVLGIEGVKFTGNSQALNVSDGSNVIITGSVEFTTTASNYHVSLTRKANFKMQSAYVISGGAAQGHINMVQNSTMQAAGCSGGCVYNLTSTPTFGTAFLIMNSNATAALTSVSFTGSTAAPKFSVGYNAVLAVGGATIPGSGCAVPYSTSGCINNGGQVQ